MSKHKRTTAPGAKPSVIPAKAEKVQLLEGGGPPDDEELEDLVEALVDTPVDSDSPKSWKDFAATEINATSLETVRVKLPSAEIA